MKYWKTGVLAALGVAALAGSMGRVPLGAQEEPAWLSDYEAARAQARQSGKLLFVVFR